jgi:hypothetical protein
MTVLMVRAKVKEEHVADVEAAIGKTFAAIEEAGPTGIRYASLKAADGVTFVAVLELAEGVENPLPSLPEFQELQQSLQAWLAEPPTPEPHTVVGSYDLFG